MDKFSPPTQVYILDTIRAGLALIMWQLSQLRPADTGLVAVVSTLAGLACILMPAHRFSASESGEAGSLCLVYVHEAGANKSQRKPHVSRPGFHLK